MNKDEHQYSFNRFFIPFHNQTNLKPMRKINGKSREKRFERKLPSSRKSTLPLSKEKVSAPRKRTDIEFKMDSILNYRFL